MNLERHIFDIRYELTFGMITVSISVAVGALVKISNMLCVTGQEFFNRNMISLFWVSQKKSWDFGDFCYRVKPLIEASVITLWKNTRLPLFVQLTRAVFGFTNSPIKSLVKPRTADQRLFKSDFLYLFYPGRLAPQKNQQREHPVQLNGSFLSVGRKWLEKSSWR